jgi:hypothetical protein
MSCLGLIVLVRVINEDEVAQKIFISPLVHSRISSAGESTSVRTRNPIPPRDREPGVNAINKAEFIGLASQGQAPTRTRRTG